VSPSRACGRQTAEASKPSTWDFGTFTSAAERPEDRIEDLPGSACSYSHSRSRRIPHVSCRSNGIVLKPNLIGEQTSCVTGAAWSKEVMTTVGKDRPCSLCLTIGIDQVSRWGFQFSPRARTRVLLEAWPDRLNQGKIQSVPVRRWCRRLWRRRSHDPRRSVLIDGDRTVEHLRSWKYPDSARPRCHPTS